MIDRQQDSFDLAIKHISSANTLIWSNEQRIEFIQNLKQKIKPDIGLSLAKLQLMIKDFAQEVAFTENFSADQYPLRANPSDLFLQVFSAIAFFEEE